MMITAIREINALRGGHFEIDSRNKNRYRILVKEEMGTTAYCFSTPIYNVDNRKLVARRFEKKGDVYVFAGSNAIVTTYGNQLVLKNSVGSVSIGIPVKEMMLKGNRLCADGWEISPSFNGVIIKVNQSSIKLTVSVDHSFFHVRHCTKNFSIMQEDFHPFFSLSPLMAIDKQNKVFPTEVTYIQKGEGTYEVEVKASEGNTSCFEANLYEFKLFQDTTVESAHPDENNAFGGIAFLGRTKWMGEQWLYTRPDFSKIPELYSVHVKRVLLHLPCLYSTGTTLSVFAPTARFCSFGSNWNNKIAQTKQLATTEATEGYVTINLTDIVSDPVECRLLYTEGLILKPGGIEESLAVIATGDNYALPQILEVHYD